MRKLLGCAAILSATIFLATRPNAHADYYEDLEIMRRVAEIKSLEFHRLFDGARPNIGDTSTFGVFAVESHEPINRIDNEIAKKHGFPQSKPTDRYKLRVDKHALREEYDHRYAPVSTAIEDKIGFRSRFQPGLTMGMLLAGISGLLAAWFAKSAIAGVLVGAGILGLYALIGLVWGILEGNAHKARARQVIDTSPDVEEVVQP
ncbi:MAG: hypothetical protein AABZ44_04130 [Elusimicrobiota bacterium]